jgi:hypothetical protein
MPIDVEHDIKNQTITDVQVGPGVMETPKGLAKASQNEITVVLGNGKQMRIRSFIGPNGEAILVAHLEKNVQAIDEQVLD